MIERTERGVPKPWYPKGRNEWYSRGYVPHRDSPELIQAITFHLGDSLPQGRLEQLRDELVRLEAQLKLNGETEDVCIFNLSRHRVRRIQAWLDAGYGACILQQPPVADIVSEVLFARAGEDYELFAWSVMPNHVHVVTQLAEGRKLGEVIKAWKSVSTRRINSLLGLSGSLWERDYYDRFMRDEEHLQRAINYTEQNPVAARLVQYPEDWRWSSARKK